MKITQVKREDLFTKYGNPIRGLENAMGHIGQLLNLNFGYKNETATLDDMIEGVKLKQIIPEDFYRLKGNGSKSNPGKLVRFLFNCPSGKELRQIKIENDFGAGI